MNHKPLKSTVNCGICATPLVYSTEPRKMKCNLCGHEENSLIYCPEGHYICDSCHSKAAIDVLRHILHNTNSTSPVAILEQAMAHPSVPMHGPEHHIMVPAIIVASVRNTGYPVPEDAIEKAISRAVKVPGGWCGFYGDCGAAVGVGIAVSVLTKATPLTGKERSLAMAATSASLTQITDDQPRCCKRSSRLALEIAIDFLKNRMGINLQQEKNIRCVYSSRNRECAREQCRYFQPSDRKL